MNCNLAPITGSVAAYQDCGGPPMGLFAYPGPIPSQISSSLFASIAARNMPVGILQRDKAIWATLTEAMLRARGLIYFKSNAGDCGLPSSPSGITSGQIVGLSGTAASGVTGGLATVGILSGPATAGISTAIAVAVAGIEDIFTHHAQAVANERATICSVVNYFNPIVTQIDKACASGQITDSQAIAYLKQVGQQAINGLQSILKTCNAACYFIAWIRCQMDFASSYYPAIFPSNIPAANAPGSAPTLFGSAPGGVPDTFGSIAPAPYRTTPESVYAPAGPDPVAGFAAPLLPNRLLPSGCTANCNPDYLNRGYNQETGQSGQAADVPQTTNWVMWGALAAIVVAFIALIGALRG